MNIRNTSRQSGGAGTRLKVNAKLKRFLVTCLILAGGYIVCGFLYVFLDQILNGFMREWIERNFIYTEWMALGDADVDGYRKRKE